MKRALLIVLAPVAAAGLLVAVGVYRPDAGSTAAALGPASAADTAVVPGGNSAGTLVLGGQVNDLAIGLAVRPTPANVLEVEAMILGPDGARADDLAVTFVAGENQAAATPCGSAGYCATLPDARPTTLDVRIEGVANAARFDLPARWEPADELLARVTRVYESLTSVAFDEQLSAGPGKGLETRWEIVAPDRLSYRISGGPSARVVGDRRWDRTEGGPWVESPQTPLRLPEPPWTAAVTDASLLGSETVGDRDVWVVSFLDRAALPTWFTLWIDKETFRTLELRMTTASHFMRQRYRSFDEPLTIEPPG